MTKIDPGRLRKVRSLRGMTLEGLARAARPLTKQTIYRWERGEGTHVRRANLELVSKALDVEAAVLTGEKPLPALERDLNKPADDARYQINVRVSPAVRNAYSLAAMRYHVSVSQIVESAPFLLSLVAELSLQRRRTKLEAIKEAYAGLEAHETEFPHLPNFIGQSVVTSWESIAAEEKSIEQADLFGASIPGGIFFGSEDQYDEDTDNPFAVFLRGLASQTGDAVELTDFGPRLAPSYTICRAEAVTLAGGDDDLAAGILAGHALIHEIPREQLRPAATVERVALLRPKVEASREASMKALNELFADIDSEGVVGMLNEALESTRKDEL